MADKAETSPAWMIPPADWDQLLEEALSRLDVPDPYQLLYIQAKLTELHDAGREIHPEILEKEAEWFSLAAKLGRGVEVERGYEIVDRLRELEQRLPQEGRPPETEVLNKSLLALTRLRGRTARTGLLGRIAAQVANAEGGEDASKPFVDFRRGLVTFPADHRRPTLHGKIVRALSDLFDRDAPMRPDGTPDRDRAGYIRRVAEIIEPYFPKRYATTDSSGLLGQALDRYWYDMSLSE